jgi:hypothetical protein
MATINKSKLHTSKGTKQFFYAETLAIKVYVFILRHIYIWFPSTVIDVWHQYTSDEVKFKYSDHDYMYYIVVN